MANKERENKMNTEKAEGLRAWAKGLLPLEASIELLVGALDGRLLQGPWVRQDEQGRPWFDPELAEAEQGYLSGGERRLLLLAMSLADSRYSVNLNDVVTGLDPDNLQLVLEVLAHAGAVAPRVAGACGINNENEV